MTDYTFYNNSLFLWLSAAGVALAIYLAARIIIWGIIRLFGRVKNGRKSEWTENAVKLLHRIHPLFLITAAVFAGSLILELPKTSVSILKSSFFIITLLQIGILVSGIIGLSIENYRSAKIEKNAGAVTMLSAMSLILRILLWSLLLLLMLDNFGVNVTTLLAGLGVGGIAVALAVQNILGDVFASFSIVLDKPFVIGDFIIVDEHLGTVEHVGLKTTRIRSLSGEQLVFSNDDLLRSRIRNFKRMFERRVVFSIGVIYQTPIEKLKAIPEMIRGFIEAQDAVRFDRAHFKGYGAYSLDFEIVYWVLDPDYNRYMDVQQAINLEIFRKFKEENIEFAYPTRLLYLEDTTEDSPHPDAEQTVSEKK